VAIIDDEAGNVAALESLLKQEYQVQGFSDSMQALAYLDAHPVDVVLTDQRMPGLMGTELLIKLKEKGRRPVSVIVTGYTDVKDLVFCINEGLLYRYVLKPWSPDDIRGAVREGVRSARQREALQRLIPEQVLQRIFPEGLEALVPGRFVQLSCAVMFTDLRGFSTMAETLGTEPAYKMLMEYFALLTPIIARHGGFIDKFMGDGVLAIFDAHADYYARAIACGMEMHETITQFHGMVNGQLIQKGDWRVGIGIAEGTVTLGTIGCADRVEITVLGDTVNTAARLEELCKRIGATVVTEDRPGWPRPEGLRSLGMVPLRGKKRPCAIAEWVTADRQGLAASADIQALITLHADGLWSESLALLQQLAERWPEDQVLQGVLQQWTQQGCSLHGDAAGKNCEEILQV
jgi:class 3 adenylate cyclase